MSAKKLQNWCKALSNNEEAEVIPPPLFIFGFIATISRMVMSLFAFSGLLIAISSGVMAFLMFVIGKTKLHTLIH